jgi:outer membrane receptor protein involved in Fe transport
VTDGVTMFGTLLWTDRHAIEAQGDQRLNEVVPSSNPFLHNRPSDPIRVAYDLVDDVGILTNDDRVRAINLTLGADFAIGPRWHLSTSIGEVVENEHQHTLGAADTTALDNALQTTLNPFGDGSNTSSDTLAAIRVEPKYQSKSELREFYSSIGGPLLDLPGGPLSGAFGMELRYQRFASELSPPTMGSNLTRHLFAGFAEVVAPLFGPANALPGVRKLDVSLAGRYERYSDFGRSITPRVGVAWTPVLGLQILSSWGKSFRAPNLADLDEHSNISFTQSFPDASSRLGSSEALVVSGKNAGLTPERATTGTFGVSIAPAALPGFHASASYFHIVFKDRIQSTDFDINILNDPSVQDIVIRNPSIARRKQICDDANNHFTGTEIQCLQASMDAIVDLRVRNLATLHTEGIDFNTAYGFDSSWGHVTLDLESTYLLDYSLVDMPHDARVSVLNTENNPINLKMEGGFKWEWRRAWTRVGVNYANSYRDIATVPQRNIGPWLTFDLQLGYRLGEGVGTVLEDMEIVANVQNVGGRDPPFAINRSALLGYDQENADPNGRVVKLMIQKRW